MNGVSCVMPTTSRFDIMPLIINSYNEQTFHPRELIIVHNDEQSLPYSLVAQVGGDVKIISFSKRMMAAKARNIGIKESRYHYVAKCDDDDWYFPGRLELMVKTMDANSSLLGVAYGLMSSFDIVSYHYGFIDKPNWYFDGSIMSRKDVLLAALKKTEGSGINPCPFKWLKDNIFRNDISKIARLRDLSHLLVLFHGENDSISWEYATGEGTEEDFVSRFPSKVVDFVNSIYIKRKDLR